MKTSLNFVDKKKSYSLTLMGNELGKYVKCGTTMCEFHFMPREWIYNVIKND
jgi:hypothetical protein